MTRMHRYCEIVLRHAATGHERLYFLALAPSDVMAARAFAYLAEDPRGAAAPEGWDVLGHFAPGTYQGFPV